MVTDVAEVVTLPPGPPATVYPVIGLPPSLAGALHDTRASPLTPVAEATTFVGAPGTPMTLVVAVAVSLAGVGSGVSE